VSDMMRSYRIRENADITELLRNVKNCRASVFFETEDGDRLNLKSVLSQYVVAVLSEKKEILAQCSLKCTEEDFRNLERYLTTEGGEDI